jgi:hypothetical protein
MSASELPEPRRWQHYQRSLPGTPLESLLLTFYFLQQRV